MNEVQFEFLSPSYLGKMAVQFKLCLQVSFTLFVYLSSLIRAQNFRREKQGVSFAKFIRTPSVKLVVHSVASLSVSKLGECTFECLNLKGCESVNFGRTSFDGKHSCELLRINKFAKAKQVVPNDKFYHYYIKVSKKRRIQPDFSTLLPKTNYYIYI